MSGRFAEIAFTPQVKALQHAAGSRAHYARFEGDGAAASGPGDELGAEEREFLEARDSFYVATVGETGWPYVQHRGGPAGFIKVVDAKTLAFADFRGNRQYVSVGNLAGDARVALIAVDYPHRQRLKLFGHARAVTAAEDAALVERVKLPGYRAAVERAIVISVDAFDWNCPQHIVPRYTEQEIETATRPLRERLEALEAENLRLRADAIVRPATRSRGASG